MKRFSLIATACSILLLLSGTKFSKADDTAQPRLAPGVLITVPPSVDYASTYNRADLVEVLASLKEVDPELADDPRFNPEMWAKDVRFARNIWCLQFSFKPLRIVYVDIPNKRGSFDKKAVWYLVYNVKNVGPADLVPVKKERTVQTDAGERTYEMTEYTLKNPGGSVGSEVDKEMPMPVAADTNFTSKLEQKNVPQTRDAPLTLRDMPGLFAPTHGNEKSIRFEPQFILATDALVLGTSTDNHPETGEVTSQAETSEATYLDQVVPIAMGPIMKREGMSKIPETTVSITKKPLNSGEDLWGVAMWTDIDPRITKFSVYVSGLSNEYRWENEENPSGKVGEDRSMERKVLKINWWRRGDQHTLTDAQIQYGQPGTVDFDWIFR